MPANTQTADESLQMPSEHAKTRTKDETEEPGETTDETAQRTCDECGGTVRENEQQGELVCEDCGLVIDETQIDRGPEWRSFDQSDRNEKSRVGAPVTNRLHDKGLSTNIDWRNKDSYGKAITGRKRQRLNRLRTWNERFRTRDSKERNLQHALGEIQRMASALGLGNQIQETAGVMYRRCLDEDMVTGRSIEGMATACLYASARQCNVPRSLDEVVPVSRVDHQEVSRAYRYISQELGLKIEPSDPRQFLNRFISELDIQDKNKVRRTAEALLDDAEAANLHSGKSPTGLAAAAIYTAALMEGEKQTQADVARVCDVTEVTIRNRYQEIVEVSDRVPVSTD